MSNQGRGWAILKCTQIYDEGSGGRLRPQLGPGQRPDWEGGGSPPKAHRFSKI